jgi:hypothetical protein
MDRTYGQTMQHDIDRNQLTLMRVLSKFRVERSL